MSKHTVGVTAPVGMMDCAASQLPAGSTRSCPFCGCPQIGASEYDDHKGGRVWMCFCGEGTCSARVLADTKERAIAKWQREPNTAPVTGSASVFNSINP